MNEICYPAAGESLEDYLWRLGCLKKSGVIDTTWTELAEILNNYTGNNLAESTWRKRFQKSYAERDNNTVAQEQEEPQEEQHYAPMMKATAAPLSFHNFDSGDTDGDEELDHAKLLVRSRDERAAMNRAIRRTARGDALYDLFAREIVRYDNTMPPDRKPVDNGKKKAMLVMLSDIHYGLTYSNRCGEYNSDIARDRLERYADAIIDSAEKEQIRVCYLALMGDLISGMIHTTVRIENKENVVEQVVGVSEAISDFIARLSHHFNAIYVASVPGNHSRMDINADNALRKEKLDSLVPWYCRTKLENITHVIFTDNVIDDTVGSFSIYGKNYVFVHGDYDSNLQQSAVRISHLTSDKIDYLLAGHLHVPDMRFEQIAFIRNGSVCGSGDEYTVRNRLFAPPCQVFMICSEVGVESIHPAVLEGS